jgi:hypothetical protein
MFDQTLTGEAVQMKAHGIGVHIQLFGDRDDAQRKSGCAHFPQHRAAATGWFLV